MNNIKLLATLFVGIFIGYILATISVIDQQDARNIMLDEQTVTAKNQSSLSKKHFDDSAAAIVQPVDAFTTEENTDSLEVEHVTNSTYQALEQKYQQLTSSLQASENKITSLKLKLAELEDSEISSTQMEDLVDAELDDSAISTSQMEDLVDAPFKDLVMNFTGAVRENIYNFHQTEDDDNWGYNMQNYLSDFILTHNNINDISLVSVTCKHQMCELLVIQHLDNGWNKIAQDLSQQAWWKFSSANSFAGNAPDAENSIAIYIFLSV
tara:strand:- start:565 stop:1365 length:801 start_codon:yes stop_codon:yes gene_type:complete